MKYNIVIASTTKLAYLSLFSLGLLWLQTQPGFGQVGSSEVGITSFRVVQLSKKEGLPFESVHTILQDSVGFIWVGGNGALARYDGYEFKAYRRIPRDTTSLGALQSRALYLDKDGYLWVTGDQTTSRFDPATEKFKRYNHHQGSQENRLFGYPTAIAGSPEEPGVIWVGSYGPRSSDRGISRLDVETGTTTNYTEEDVLSGSIWSILLDRAGTLWMASDEKLFTRRGNSGSFKTYSIGSEVSGDALSNRPGRFGGGTMQNTTLFEDSSGRLWVGKYDGLYLLNGELNSNTSGSEERNVDRIFSFYQPTPEVPEALENHITALTEDQEGRLWVGTRKGVFLFDLETESFIPLSVILENADVYSIYIDNVGFIWIGTEGSGLFKLEPWENPFNVYRRDADNPNNLSWGYIRGGLEDNEGIIWVSTSEAIYRINRISGTVSQYKHDSNEAGSISVGPYGTAFQSRSGELWIGTERGVLNKMNLERPGYFDRFQVANLPVNQIWEDRSGSLWYSSNNVGISRFDPKTGTLTTYTQETHDLGGTWTMRLYEAPSEPDVLWIGRLGGMTRLDLKSETFTNYDYEYLRGVSWVHEDRNGDFWLATIRAGGGLHRFDRETGQVLESITVEDGLAHNLVYCILEDEDGYFWLSTRVGISRFDPKTKVVTNYDERDGVPVSIFTDLFLFASAFQTSDGEMFFGGADGMLSFDPRDLIANPLPPEVVLTELEIRNEPIQIGSDGILDVSIQMTQSLTLAHTKNDLTFEYVGLHYSDPAENKYRYWLEGYEDTWIDAGSQRMARYTNLDPGTYTFKVTAANSDGVWNEKGASLHIRILPPWWKTVWAYLSYGLLATLVACMGVRFLNRRQMRLERERTMARDMEQAQAIETKNKQLHVQQEQLKDQQKKLESQNELLVQQKERLVQLDKAKSRFFANISHEFRTPLTLILSPLEKHIMKAEAGWQRSELSMMQRQAHQLLKLINQLLNLSRIDAGKLTLDITRLDLVKIMSRLVDSFSHRAKKAKISLHFVPSVDRAEIGADPDKLEHIFINLLSNAIKFTPEEGQIQIGINTLKNESLNYFECTISDTGKGIPEEKLPHIFDRFYQVDSSTTRLYEGSGIGLSLVKELVELHGGTISVESEPGIGTTFTIRLLSRESYYKENGPFEDTFDKMPTSGVLSLEAVTIEEEADLELEEAQPTAPEILIVEDNVDLREYLRRHLASRYRISEAEDGKSGLQRVCAHPPDLLIADVMMPGMDGITLCKEIKSDPSLRTIPIILLTARAEEEDRLEGLGVGVDDYITKPFSLDELMVRVENLIEVRNVLRKQFSSELIFQPGNVVLPSEDAVFIEKVRHIIEAKMGNSTFSVDILAENMGMSTRQLNRRAKMVTGLTPGVMIRTMRLHRAAQMLEENVGRVSEIALKVGFNDVRYFSRVFRQIYGVTPSEYRR